MTGGEWLVWGLCAVLGVLVWWVVLRAFVPGWVRL